MNRTLAGFACAAIAAALLPAGASAADRFDSTAYRQSVTVPQMLLPEGPLTPIPSPHGRNRPARPNGNDPTATYLPPRLARVAGRARNAGGPGAVPGAITAVAERLVGFEIQMGPYAVAELRTTDLVRDTGAILPSTGMRLFVTDTLDDPHASETQLGSGLKLIADARRKANEVKANANITVVICNPPYRERAEGMGGWIERGTPQTGVKAPLDAFRDTTSAQHAPNLKNL